ncbi:MAG TPA: FAD-dependent oxidoreductase [Intrasporangium sp.]|uniref:NAD(P)/FAD-dependent oxidoreductase n=1 Tax=Intrasporangium sp. TaxID=1925024 RepID=UPI002F94BB04
MARPQRIVVLGHGIAALTAAESVRDHGFDGELTIVGDESHAPYSRPALSKAALLDDDLAALSLPASTHGATELLGRLAAHVDLDRSSVRLDDGQELPWDGLVVATGSRARTLVPPGPGAGPDRDRPKELTLRGLDDVRLLRRRLEGRPSVVVVGGGPLGMEIASGAVEAGCTVTLVSEEPPMLRHLGPDLSEVLVTAALERGLRLVTAPCAQIRGSGLQSQVVLEDGSTLDADVVITAAGDLPNLEFLATSGLLTDGRLEVDSRGRVLVGGRARPDVVAAGDVATFPTGRGTMRVPLWTAAIDQAKVAAPALLLGDSAPELDFRPYFWTEQWGVNLKASGQLPPVGSPEVVDGDLSAGSALLRWAPDAPEGPGAAVAVNYRIPVPRLRRLAHPQPAPDQVAV